LETAAGPGRVTGGMLFMLTSTHGDALGILTFFVWFEVTFLSVPFPIYFQS